MLPRLFIPATRLIKSTIHRERIILASKCLHCVTYTITPRGSRTRAFAYANARVSGHVWIYACCPVVGRQKLRPRNGGHTPGHLARLDCNRRCICTYVRPWLYGGWHATGVCRARQLIKPTSKRCRPTAPYPALISVTPFRFYEQFTRDLPCTVTRRGRFILWIPVTTHPSKSIRCI